MALVGIAIFAALMGLCYLFIEYEDRI